MSTAFPNSPENNPPQFQQSQFQQPEYQPTQFQQPPRKSGANWFLSLLLIGLGFLFLGGAVCVVGVWYVASNIENWVVGIGREAIVAGINESEIPAQDKQEIVAQVDRVVAAYKEGKLNQADLERVLTDLEDSPALKALTLYGIENDYLQDTELTEQEIAAARTTFNRTLRGVYEGKIPDEAVWNALPDDEDDVVRLASTNADDNAADDALRLALSKLKVLADSAQIPDEPFQFDIGDEVKKLVDQALAGK